jgi:ABC-type transport system substrate-binding protein
MQGKGVFHWQDAGQLTGIHLHVTRPPFDNPHVRWAIYLVIDRQLIVEVHVLGQGEFKKGQVHIPDVYTNERNPFFEETKK